MHLCSLYVAICCLTRATPMTNMDDHMVSCNLFLLCFSSRGVVGENVREREVTGRERVYLVLQYIK